MAAEEFAVVGATFASASRPALRWQRVANWAIGFRISQRFRAPLSFRRVSELIQRVEREIQRRELFAPGERVVVGVSGGVDSMVLLDILHRLAPGRGWKLAVAHLNHQLRGRAADRDEAFVRKAARRMGLRCFVRRIQVARLAQAEGISLEMAGRQARYDFLEQAAQRFGARRIALAHHADDQIELFFLRLFRGTGSEGLGGMHWMRPARPERCFVVRPLLGEAKMALLEYAEQQGIHYQNDATNRSTAVPRNWLRQELLPRLEDQFGAGYRAAILRAMEITAAEAHYLQETAARWVSERRPAFARLPPALQRLVIRLQVRTLGCEPDFQAIEALRAAEAPIVLRPGWSLARDPTGVIWRLTRARTTTSSLAAKTFAIKGAQGKISFADMRIDWQVSSNGSRRSGVPKSKSGACEYFDADAVGRSITLRHWRPGDRFQAIGAEHAVKLQDLFVNAKIPRARRRELVIAADETGGIFWVEGLRIGDRCKVRPGTRRILKWRWKSAESDVSSA